MSDLEGQQDRLVLELGSVILADSEYTDQDWDSLSLILEFKGNSESMSGYKYSGARWRAATPANFDVMDKIVELKEAMAKRTGEPWNWALLTIVAPEMKIAIDFSYDDENPWGLEAKSLDMHDYAMSLRGPDHPSVSRVKSDLPRGWSVPKER